MRVPFESVDGVELTMNGSIDFGYLCHSLHPCGKLSPLRPEGLAMPTPGSIELEQPGIFRLVDSRLKGVGIKDDNVFFRRASVFIFFSVDHRDKQQSDEDDYFAHAF